MTDPIARLNAALDGHYRVERELGQGGMAVVYLAQDLKHERQVALKVFKPELAAVVGSERFLAEIKTTANLQHPHILPLFDSGEAGGFLFYVMPYVDGESLRQKLEREGQLHVDEAVRIVCDIAEALQAAHEQGVIHRDIKPANILLSRGRPLVADFGIALAVSQAGGGRLTETGLSLGTPYYMSPEQASGDRPPTAASDVYALGCVLYEMLVGEPPYMGNTAQAVLGRILLGSPMQPSQLRKTIPANVDGAILKALEKLPADRFGSATDLARALRDPGFRHERGAATAARAEAVGPWRGLALAMVAVAVLSVGMLSWALMRGDEAPVTRFVVGLEGEDALWYTGTANLPRLSIAPDGQRLVYVGWDLSQARGQILRLRIMDQLGSTPLAGTEGAEAPAISPDGESVAFLGPAPGNEKSLRIASLLGGAPQEVVPAGVTAGPTWDSEGFVQFIGRDGRTLMRVHAAGGPVDTVATLDLGPVYSRYVDPFMVTDGTMGVTAIGPSRGPEVHVVDLDSGESVYSVVGSGGLVTAGHLLYVTDGGTLMAQRVGKDGRAAPDSRPTQVLDGIGVRSEQGIIDLTVSRDGTLFYTTQPSEAPERWEWVSPDGSVELLDPAWTEDIEFEAMALSPLKNRVALEMESGDRVDIWIKDMEGGRPSQLTFDGDQNQRPAWSPDGRRVAYIATVDGHSSAMVRAADGSGSAEPLFDHDRNVYEVRWSRDGAWLLAVLEGSSYDIVAVRVGSGETPEPILASDFDEWEPELSPNGRWLAYVSTETAGRAQVFVVPFPSVDGGKWRLTTDGGREPRWSDDGTELYIRHEDGSGIDVVDMSSGPSNARRRTVIDFPPEEYYEVNPYNRLYEVGSDGRFLMLRAGQGDITGDLVIIQNFFEELRGRVGS